MPLTADRSVIRRDIPLMLAISVYLFFISANSIISRVEGATLLLGVVLYSFLNYRISAGKSSFATESVNNKSEYGAAAIEVTAEIEEIGIVDSRFRQVALIVVGIACVVVGAQVLINAAVVIMKAFGASEKFIGLTIVALGTSLPELATSIVAAMRKEMDISIGNLVGSNVFNILCVIGAAGLVHPITIPGGFFESGLVYDYLMMMFTSALPLLLMVKSGTIQRSGGLVLLTCYGAYLAYLVTAM
jgi:cation:H+ antiporter